MKLKIPKITEINTAISDYLDNDNIYGSVTAMSSCVTIYNIDYISFNYNSTFNFIISPSSHDNNFLLKFHNTNFRSLPNEQYSTKLSFDEVATYVDAKTDELFQLELKYNEPQILLLNVIKHIMNKLQFNTSDFDMIREIHKIFTIKQIYNKRR